jgi:hypothetical protein
LTSTQATEEAAYEKQINVAMRMIGHEVLVSLNDCESRILPIEKNGQQYKIPFESELSFFPNSIVSSVFRVMMETNIAYHYVVEVEHCESQKIVHSFEIGNPNNTYMTPCGERALPRDCYSLLITLIGTNANSNQLSVAKDSNSGATAKTSDIQDSFFRNFINQKATFVITFLLIIPFLIGFAIYFFKKNKIKQPHPHLIKIGASQFDKKRKILSYADSSIELSHKESELLSLLFSAANKPLERELILQKVWGDEGNYIGRTLDVFISKLRKKLEADSSVKIINIRGVGYQLVLEQTNG